MFSRKTILSEDKTISLELLASVIGVVGVCVVMVAYFLLQIGRVSPNSMSYSFANLLGSLFILVSLIYEWNLAAFLMESAWAVISIYGMAKIFQAGKRNV